MPEKKHPWLLLVLILMGGLPVGLTFLWIGLKFKEFGPELILPLVVIAGVILLMASLALVAAAFSLLDLTDRAQPLALPEGSVRAVIALMLLIVFAITSIFLYINVSNSGKLKIADKLSAAEVVELRKHVTVVFTLPPFVEPVAAQAGAPQGQQPGQQAGGTPQAGTPPAAQTYTVYYRDLSSPAGDDLAKQLVVLLGTLVTAVASFYFGSSSVSSARDAAERAQRTVGGPNAKGVTPGALKADDSAQQLTVTGENLANVVSAELRRADGGALRADSGSVKASASSVTFMVTVPAGTAAGAWDVVVSDNANNHSAIAGAVSISA